MIIFFYGEDDFRAKRKIRELKDKFVKKIDKSGGNISYLDGKTATLKELNGKIGSASLLASKRMVIVENIFLNRQKELLVELLEYLKNLEKTDNDNILIFFENFLKNKIKAGKNEMVKLDGEGRGKPLTKKEKELFNFLSKGKFVQNFKNLSNFELVAWVKNEVKARGGKISDRGAQILASLAGNNLWQMNGEINKLINYKSGKNPKLTEGGKNAVISEMDIAKLVRGKFDENIFALTDAIGARNKVQAVKLLENQYEAGLTNGYLINMIIRQIKILLQIRNALDHGHSSRKIINELNLNPFVVQKGINQVRNFSLKNLKNFLKKLIEIDYQMKTGRAEAKILLNLLIGRI